MEQRRIIRFEKRGRECNAVARLIRFTRRSHSESKKSAAPFGVRDHVLTRVKSPRYDPKPVDPGLARVKRRESCVEARTVAAIQALG